MDGASVIIIIPVNSTDQSIFIGNQLRQAGHEAYTLPVYRHQSRRFKQLFYTLRALFTLAFRRVDVIFAMELLQGFIGVLIAKIKRCPVIIYLIDDTLHLRSTGKRPLNPIGARIINWIQEYTI